MRYPKWVRIGLRRDKFTYRRALMRGQREAHKRGLDVRGVRVNRTIPFGWETWHTSDFFGSLRSFFPYGREPGL